MKHNNFLSTLSPQQQYEIRRWCAMSSILLISSIGALVCYFTPQLYALYSIKKEISVLKNKTEGYSSLTSNRNSLKKESELLQKKRIKINTYLTAPKNPHQYIAAIIRVCDKGTIIEHIRKDKKNIELAILCTTIAQATALSQHLNDIDYFTDMKLLSLQQQDKDNQFKCVVKGTIQSTQ